MRLLTYDRSGARRLGAWVEGAVVDLPDAVGHPAFPPTMEALVARNGGTTLDAARAALELPDVVAACVVPRPRILAPLLPSALVEFATNADQDGGSAHRSILGPDERLTWPRSTAGLACAVQVGCVVGRTARNLTPRQASKTIFGYMLMTDWTDEGGLGFATSLGPWVLTPDDMEHEAGDAEVLTSVDGTVSSRVATDPSRWPFAEIISRASRSDEIGPGDVFGSAAFSETCLLTLERRHDRSAVVDVEFDGLGVLRTRLTTRSRSPRHR